MVIKNNAPNNLPYNFIENDDDTVSLVNSLGDTIFHFPDKDYVLMIAVEYYNLVGQDQQRGVDFIRGFQAALTWHNMYDHYKKGKIPNDLSNSSK